MNFNHLGLKKLICTCYAGSLVSHTELNDLPLFHQDEKLPYKIEITEVPDMNGDGATDLSDIELLLRSNNNNLTILDGDGDFRSEESVEFLKEADVVVTNPPFSLFREFVAQLMQYEKKFLIIGNINAVTYKEIFPLIANNKLWLGHSIHSGDREFRVPDSYPLNASGSRIDANGRKYIRVKGVRWYTNLDYKERHEDLPLYKHYTPEEYPKYDNYDAINVDKTSDIPCDYFEDVGVPITYLDKHNPDQFELVKFRKGDDGKDLTYTDLASKQASKQASRLLHTSESSSEGRKRNGVMGVPITFLDKYNPDQFEIVEPDDYRIGGARGETLAPGADGWHIGGKRKYARVFVKRKV